MVFLAAYDKEVVRGHDLTILTETPNFKNFFSYSKSVAYCESNAFTFIFVATKLVELQRSQ